MFVPVGRIQHCKSMLLNSGPYPGINPDWDPDPGFYADPDMEFNLQSGIRYR
jgi:hypothetical protein